MNIPVEIIAVLLASVLGAIGWLIHKVVDLNRELGAAKADVTAAKEAVKIALEKTK